VDKFLLPDFLPAVDAKLIVRFSDEKNQTLMIVTTLLVINKGFPVGWNFKWENQQILIKISTIIEYCNG
jgi:hypothetical protein